MNFKYLGSIVLSLLIMSACQQGNDVSNEEQDMEETQQPQDQQQMPGQPPQQQTTDVSDAELQQFASVAEQIQVMNQEAQQKMVGAVEGEGLEVERFSEIQQAQQMPDQEVDATDEEMEKYNAALEELEEIQVQAQQDMQEKIQDEGMSEERYQEIGMALQSDPELQAKFQAMQQQGQPQQGQPMN